MQYFGGGCGLSVGKTSYPVNTCAAASSALPKGYVRTTGTAPEADAFFSEKSAPTTQRASSLEAPFPTSLPRTQANERSTTEEDIAAELALAMSAGGTEVASFIASCVQPNNNYAAIVSVKQVRFLFYLQLFAIISLQLKLFFL